MSRFFKFFQLSIEIFERVTCLAASSLLPLSPSYPSESYRSPRPPLGTLAKSIPYRVSFLLATAAPARVNGICSAMLRRGCPVPHSRNAKQQQCARTLSSLDSPATVQGATGML